MNNNQIKEELTALKRKYASTFARTEVLKLKTSNRNEILIQRKQQELQRLEDKITALKNTQDKKHDKAES